MSSGAYRLLSAALIGLTFGSAASAGPVSVEAGKALAIEACSACHQVIPTQKRPAPVANPDEGVPVTAPTFAAVAQRCLPADQLRSKIANPHYPMREQVFGAVDLDSLAAYIASLAPTRLCPIR